MLELYNAPVSTCSQKVRMALYEKRLLWVDRVINFGRREHLSARYLALNPHGVVPTLVHDNQVIVDSSVINEYLDDVFPDHSLRPQNALELARMRVWRQYIDEVATTSIRYPSFNAAFVHIWANMTDEDHQAFVNSLPLRKHFYQKMGRKGFPKEEIDAAIERLRNTLERMELALGETKWLAHDTFTLADISIMPTIVRMEDLGLSHLWQDLPRVLHWFERIQLRPAFAQTYPKGSRDIHPSC